MDYPKYYHYLCPIEYDYHFGNGKYRYRDMALAINIEVLLDKQKIESNR